MIKLTPTALEAASKLFENGGVPYVVGGAVRDTLLSVEPKDIDLLVTGLELDRILKILPGSYLTGEHFGVLRWRWQNHDEVEIAMPRTERSTGPGHKDFEATVSPDIPVEDDLARRDFTVNAMAWNIYDDVLIDHDSSGQCDIERKCVRMVNPQAFKDDPLRILRGLVLVARYGFWIEDSLTGHHMAWGAKGIKNLPAERIQEELDKIFEADYVALAIETMYEYDVMPYIFPELDACWDYDQNNPHHQQLLGPHQLSTLRHIAEISDDPDLRLAGLLHDIGKPDSAWVDPVTGSNHFYRKVIGSAEIDAWGVPSHALGNVLGDDHEIVGCHMVFTRMGQLKYPVRRIERVRSLVKHHMWNPFTSLKGARKFLNKYGDQSADLLKLRYGDQNGKYESPTNKEHNLITQRGLIETVRQSGDATSTADLAINGHNLIEAGIKPGPGMGEILNDLTNAVLEEPSLNDKETLITMALDLDCF